MLLFAARSVGRAAWRAVACHISPGRATDALRSLLGALCALRRRRGGWAPASAAQRVAAAPWSVIGGGVREAATAASPWDGWP